MTKKREITIETDLAAFRVAFGTVLRTRVTVTELGHVGSCHTDSVFIKELRCWIERHSSASCFLVHTIASCEIVRTDAFSVDTNAIWITVLRTRFEFTKSFEIFRTVYCTIITSNFYLLIGIFTSNFSCSNLNCNTERVSIACNLVTSHIMFGSWLIKPSNRRYKASWIISWCLSSVSKIVNFFICICWISTNIVWIVLKITTFITVCISSTMRSSKIIKITWFLLRNRTELLSWTIIWIKHFATRVVAISYNISKMSVYFIIPTSWLK